MAIILRPQAKEQQLEFYYTGKPCRNGNVAQRRTSNGVCQCDACKNASAKNAAQRLRYENDPEYREHKNAIVRKSRAANKERSKEWARKYRDNNRDAVNATSRAWYNAKPDGERQEYANAKYYKNILRSMINNAKARAKKQNIPFNITIDDITVPEVCPVLEIPILWAVGQGRMSDNSPSLDKIVPELGYVPGNVCVISWRANRLKSDATLAELESVCDYVRQAGAYFISP